MKQVECLPSWSTILIPAFLKKQTCMVYVTAIYKLNYLGCYSSQRYREPRPRELTGIEGSTMTIERRARIRQRAEVAQGPYSRPEVPDAIPFLLQLKRLSHCELASGRGTWLVMCSQCQVIGPPRATKILPGLRRYPAGQS